MFGKSGLALVLALVLVLGSVLFVGGCVPAQREPAQAAQIGIMLSVGGRGDKSFNDAAIEGLERAKTELGIE